VFNPTKAEGVCDACGNETVLRDDDKPETVQKRLTVYHDQTQPLIDYYKNMNILKSVDGTKPMDEVFSDIVAILGE
jgi:adenylate kinase